jgi:hypothetical protein
MADHKVNIIITEKGKLRCEPRQVRVDPRDAITWSLQKKYPFGIMVKFPFTPLIKHFCLSSLKAEADKKVVAKVLSCAPPGHYPYGVGAYDGRKLLVEDPEIIVRPPGGRG